MASLPYFKFYPADFMGSGKVQIMHPAEKGIYISLLCYEWQEGPLPDDSARLGRIAGASSREMKEAWPSVRACFSIDENGCLYHPRLERERDEAAIAMERRAKMAEGGRKGGLRSAEVRSERPLQLRSPGLKGASRVPSTLASRVPSTLASRVPSTLASRVPSTLASGVPSKGGFKRPFKQLRSSDTKNSDTQNPEEATTSGERPREGPIGEMESDLARFLEPLPDARTRRRIEAQARMVLTGDDRKAWETDQGTTVPEAERPELFRLALGYHADGSQKSFRSSVRYAVKLYAANERAPPDPRMGRAERKLAERIAKLQSVDLSTAFQS